MPKARERGSKGEGNEDAWSSWEGTLFLPTQVPNRVRNVWRDLAPSTMRCDSPVRCCTSYPTNPKMRVHLSSRNSRFNARRWQNLLLSSIQPQVKKPGEACTRWPPKKNAVANAWKDPVVRSDAFLASWTFVSLAVACVVLALAEFQEKIHLLNKVVTHACRDRLDIRPIPHRSKQPKNGICLSAPFRRHLPFVSFLTSFLQHLENEDTEER